jgi:hypothetical protein
VKLTTNATDKLPKFGLPSRRSSSKKRNGLIPGQQPAEEPGETGTHFTLLALTLAAVYN